MLLPFPMPSAVGLKAIKLFFLPFRNYSNQKMRILNVAEKNDAAKNIAALLSSGKATSRESLSVYNKIYEFDCDAFGQNCRMVMTSVSGHILTHNFTYAYKSWKSCNPVVLFEAPITVDVLPDSVLLKNSLEKELKNCSKLVIWTDCDREGENIGFEIIKICQAVKPNIEIHRAKFSEITVQSVKRALKNLQAPNKHLSDAVEVRQELDLRIGAAFTRFQTLYLQKAFPKALSDNVISYGSCQFPTLGFVVDRFKAISEFKPEKYWQLNAQHKKNDLSVTFNWKRNRLFHKLACEALYDKCVENRTAKVENIETKPQIKRRPKPLDTVLLQKLSSKKLKISAVETLRIAEHLYTQGVISYPRTETNIFSKEIDLVQLVQLQTEDHKWGEFAERVLRDSPKPNQGNKSDKAHPPIHPIKHCSSLSGNEKRIYELIVRHFLACLSRDAEGLETTVDIDVAGEKFSAKGLMITAKNYLEVYPYEKWEDKEIHIYGKDEMFEVEMLMMEGETAPPELLTESDLIGLMEKHGIGTDATHADHIETIKQRLYVGLQDNKYFVPRTLGMGLVEAYNNMGYGMAKPELRAELEADLKRICEQKETPSNVLSKHITKYKTIYEEVKRQMNLLSEAIQSYIKVEPTTVDPDFFTESEPKKVGKCPKCSSNLILKRKKNGEKYIGCSGYPKCSVALWLPSFVLDVSLTMDTCPTCGPEIRLVQFKFKKGSCPYPSDYVGCIGGCDWHLLRALNSSMETNKSTTKRRNVESTTPLSTSENDSGYISLNDNSSEVKGDAVKCLCGVPALSLTGKKSNRKYFKCGSPESKCNFFMWDNASNNQNKATVDGEDMRCYCSIPCRRLETMKEGPNKGRYFYSCGKSYSDPDKCNFFKWADEEENQESNTNVDMIESRKRTGHRSGPKADGRKTWTLWSIR